MFFISQKELFKSKLSFLIYNDFSTFYSSFFRSLNTIVFNTVGTLPAKTVFPPPKHNVGPYKRIEQQWAVVIYTSNIDWGGGFYPYVLTIELSIGLFCTRIGRYFKYTCTFVKCPNRL